MVVRAPARVWKDRDVDCVVSGNLYYFTGLRVVYVDEVNFKFRLNMR